MIRLSPQGRSLLGEGDYAQAVAVARLGGHDPGGVQTRGPTAGKGWRAALAFVPKPVWAVFAVFGASLLTFWYDSIGPIDWVVGGHLVAVDRYLFLLGIVWWPLAIRVLGRGSPAERTAWRWAIASFGLAALTAWISVEHMSLGWYAFHLPLGIGQAMVVRQLWAWRRVAGLERGGVLILTAGACVELAVYVLVQSWGWDASCIYGLGLTCIEGPFVKIAPAAIEILALAAWASWLTREISRGGA